MRKIYSIFLAVLLSASVFAQSPQKMSYQAVIRNSSDQLVTNHAVGMRVSILQGSSTGTAVYVETQLQVLMPMDLVSIEIGGGTIVTGTFRRQLIGLLVHISLKQKLTQQVVRVTI
jgi:hypothetical protein